MPIIDPNTNKPISSERKTVLQVVLVDQQAMSSQPKQYAMGFELDRPDRPTVARVLQHVANSVVQQLESIDFFQQEAESPQPDET